MSSPPRDPENVARDPEALAFRSTDPEPIVRVRETDSQEPNAGASDRREHAERGLLADPGAADLLAFPGLGDDDRRRARRFLDGTDFSATTVYAEQRAVGECYRLRLCWVIWSETEIRTQYGRAYRDWDVACSTENRDRTLHLIRVPEALDPDAVSSYGSGVHSRGCVPPTRDRKRGGSDENASGDTGNASDRRSPGGRP